MNPDIETVAAECEEVVSANFDASRDNIVSFTPSIVSGRRYIGIKYDNGQQFMVEINVTEV